MQWIINELSLEAQFTDLDDFENKIGKLLCLKHQHAQLKANLLAARGELNRIVLFNNLTFSEIVSKKINKNLRKQILSWLDKNGPFWTDQRVPHHDDYFSYQSRDVTDLGLGECARRKIGSLEISAYSFSGVFSQTPLAVDHGLPEDPQGQYLIDNIFDIESLQQSANCALPKPHNWDVALTRLIEQFPNLMISDQVFQQMFPVPFGIGIYDAIVDRCRVLSEFIDSRDKNGRNTPRSQECLDQYFGGEKAWFVNSSETERAQFKSALTFADLIDQRPKLFPYHGRIKNPQLRIHFEWPIAQSQKQIQIVYIGPKLTKR